jgi:hypothetical protein
MSNRKGMKIGGDRMKKMLVVLVGLLGFLPFGSAAGLTVRMSNTKGAKGITVEVLR